VQSPFCVDHAIPRLLQQHSPPAADALPCSGSLDELSFRRASKQIFPEFQPRLMKRGAAGAIAQGVRRGP
jgi:hypothetical protein